MKEREPCRVCGGWSCQDQVACRQAVYAALDEARGALAEALDELGRFKDDLTLTAALQARAIEARDEIAAQLAELKDELRLAVESWSIISQQLSEAQADVARLEVALAEANLRADQPWLLKAEDIWPVRRLKED